jgi:serine/threonine-protein kinase
VLGTTVGSWRILNKLSVGGMGTVYRAEHTLIGKFAAVKVLHPELSTNHDIVNRFFNEAKATTSIKHPGIVEILDFGYMPAKYEGGNGDAYLVMEFLDGMSLARRLKTRGRMGEGDAAILLRGVCSALSAAHAKGIIHRDLKPDNIFLIPDPESALGERPKLLDFGIAKLTEPGLAGSNTKTGAVMGTPTYMSPEQCRGTGEVDLRADLYSLGCILYELVAGRPPFTNQGAGELIGAHLYVQPERPSKHQPGLSTETETLIMALLDKHPPNRPQTSKELGQRLMLIAQKQGWITNTSPTGITAESLRDLPVPVPSIVTKPDARVHDSENDAMTSTSTPTAFSAEEALLADVSRVDVVDKPTTLSLAASQSVIDVPKRRGFRGLGLAMVAAATLAGGTVAFITLHGGGGEVAGGRVAAPVAATPAPPATPPTVAPPKPAAPTPPPVEVAPPIEAPKPVVVATPAKPIKHVVPVAVKHPVIKPAVTTPPADKPKPPETKKPSLIETDID